MPRAMVAHPLAGGIAAGSKKGSPLGTPPLMVGPLPAGETQKRQAVSFVFMRTSDLPLISLWWPTRLRVGSFEAFRQVLRRSPFGASGV